MEFNENSEEKYEELFEICKRFKKEAWDEIIGLWNADRKRWEQIFK